MKKTLIIVSLLIAIPTLIYAADRLIIKDDGGTTRFKVEDNAVTTITGKDSNNSFQLKVLGQPGGDLSTQVITDVPNGRLSITASTADDVAPRLAMVGPQERNKNIRGWAVFDYGSRNFDLEDAQFTVRHINKTNFIPMFTVFGRDAVAFPKSDVKVGIGTDNPNQPLQMGGGAFCDGRTWTNASSRELKEDIAELNREEAFATLRQMTPVKFSYKEDTHNETNVGFIAEDVPELVATPDRKGMVSMEVVAVLTKVVQEQQEMIAKLNEEVESLKSQMHAKADL